MAVIRDHQCICEEAQKEVNGLRREVIGLQAELDDHKSMAYDAVDDAARWQQLYTDQQEELEILYTVINQLGEGNTQLQDQLTRITKTLNMVYDWFNAPNTRFRALYGGNWTLVKVLGKLKCTVKIAESPRSPILRRETEI